MVEVLNDSPKEKPFIIYFGNVITYGEFDEYSNGIAAQVSMYCEPGDRVGLIAENIPQFPMIQYAVWKNSCIFIPLSPLDSETEIIDKIKFTGISLIVVSREFMEKFSGVADIPDLQVLYTDPETFGNLPENTAGRSLRWEKLEELNIRKKRNFMYHIPEPDDVAMLVFTSGTSGRQKAAEIRHRNVYSTSYIYREWFDVTSRDKNLATAPFFHITGLIFGISLTIISRSSMVLTYRFNAANTLETIESEKTTITMFVATAYRAMINSWSGLDNIKKRLSSMRIWSAGGMPMPVKIEREWKAMTGKWIYMAYGLTESTSPVALWEYPYAGDLITYKGTLAAGKPVYYTRIDRGRDGELLVSGPQVIDEYYNNPEDTKNTFGKSGMKTGDICYIDPDGYLYIIDRKKDLIDVSGYKVVPAEVENLIRTDNSVEDVVVVGEPDDYRGEVPVAYVKLGQTPESYENVKERLLKTCNRDLARYKVPARIKFVRAMPINASGKIKKSEIHSVEVVYQ
jgi:long-chain acyl-CoA synthetase